MKNPNYLRTLGIVALCSTLVFMYSCTSKPKDVILTLNSVKLTGDVMNNIKIIPGDYKIVLEKGAEKGTGKIAITLRIETLEPVKGWGANTGLDDFYPTLLDENDNIIEVWDGPSPNMDWDRLREACIGKKGDVNSVKFWWEFVNDIDAGWERVQKAKNIEILNTKLVNLETSSVSYSGDCEQFIKDYEAFADSYIKLLKKYKENPTDETILTEYTEASQKAIALQTDASNCTDASYANKLLEIGNKIAKAAM